MKESLKRIVDAFHRYNTEHMAVQAFGLSEDITYDALVIAPSYTPYKLSMDETCKVTTLKEGAYIAGYLVEKDGRQILVRVSKDFITSSELANRVDPKKFIIGNNIFKKAPYQLI